MSLAATDAPVAVKRMTFDDEFDIFSDSPDGTSGTWMTTFPYTGIYARTLPDNHEAEYYSDSSVGVNPFSLSAGILDITANPAAPGSNPYGLPYTSGLITTYGSFAQTYGYFEVRAELPSGKGLWPAFWFVPASGYTSEIDVFESIGADNTQIYSSVHGSTNGVWTNTTEPFSVPNTSTGFHTYGVDWQPNQVTFYVDGKAIGSEATPASMNQPMYMLLNLAVGGTGSWPGSPDSTTQFPATMKIDYVRAYATQYTTYVSGSAAIPAAPSANDTVIAPNLDERIIDASQNVWFIEGGQVEVNGIVDTSTSNVTALAYVNGRIWEQVGGKTWFGKVNPTDAWSPSGGTATPPISISVQNATTGGTTVVDATHSGTSTQTGATFKITAPGVANVVLGTTKTHVGFIGMNTVTVTGGTAASTITLDGGVATIQAGVGALDVTGGAGLDTYTYGKGDGGLVIRDFANGTDVLAIQSGLKPLLKTTSSQSGLVLSFGTTAGSIDLLGTTSLSNASIRWT